ncbi:hypothetical protein BC828DRAFT_418238 [Blastocladiella britannica]|nr:hypothetical protein BC828DRAFT_418238 [Blastocladiella britannica]
MIGHISYSLLAHAAGSKFTPEEAIAPLARLSLIAIKHGHGLALLPHYPPHLVSDDIYKALGAAGALGSLPCATLCWAIRAVLRFASGGVCGVSSSSSSSGPLYAPPLGGIPTVTASARSLVTLNDAGGWLLSAPLALACLSLSPSSSAYARTARTASGGTPSLSSGSTGAVTARSLAVMAARSASLGTRYGSGSAAESGSMESLADGAARAVEGDSSFPPPTPAPTTMATVTATKAALVSYNGFLD